MISSTLSARPISTSAAAASARRPAGTFALRRVSSILAGPFSVPFQVWIFSDVALSHAAAAVSPSATTNARSFMDRMLATRGSWGQAQGCARRGRVVGDDRVDAHVPELP